MFTRRYTNFWDGLFRPSKTHILGSGEVKTMTNLVVNGNFVDTTGWTGVDSTISAASNTCSDTGNGANAYPYFKQNVTGIIGRTYALTYRVRVTNSNCLSLRYRFMNSGSTESVLTPVANTWYQITVVFTANGTFPEELRLYHQYADASTANGKVMEAQYVSIVDLTDAFGAGNEPTQTEYESWINTQSNSWFDTTAQYLCNTNQWF